MMVIPTLDQSGAEKQFTLVATGLPRDEFDVRVVALTRGGPLEAVLREQGISVEILNKRWKFDPGTLWQLRSLIGQQQPQVLNSWLFAANAYVRLVGRFGVEGPRIVISERCVDSWKAGWQHWLDRRLLGRTDRVIANSESVAAFYEQRGVPRERLTTIPNGVSVPAHPGITRGELLQQLRLPADARLIMTIGRLAPQKRLRDLIWAMQLLKQVDPRCHLLICGDGPERFSLPQYTREVDAADVVHFLGHREDAASLLHLADLFWLGSEFEGMSNSLMEALATGCPVVVSDIPANRELVAHGASGYLVNLGDSAGFMQFSLKLLAAGTLREQFATAGKLRMQQDYSVAAMLEQYTRTLREEASLWGRK